MGRNLLDISFRSVRVWAPKLTHALTCHDLVSKYPHRTHHRHHLVSFVPQPRVPRDPGACDARLTARDGSPAASPSAQQGVAVTLFETKGWFLDGFTGSWPYVELVGPPGAAEDLNIGGYICRDHGALASIAGIRPPQTPQQSSCNVHDGVKLHRIGAPAAHRYRPDSLAVTDAKYRTASTILLLLLRRVMIYTKHELRTMDRGCVPRVSCK